MHRRALAGQLKFGIPFGVELDAENRWVKLASIMPWEKIDELYAQNFESDSGEVAKSSRLAFAALYIQNRLDITDVETVDQIRETPSMQYFCGFESYTTQKPFDSSLMVHFRKRISAEMIKEISEMAYGFITLPLLMKHLPWNKIQNGIASNLAVGDGEIADRHIGSESPATAKHG